MNNADAFFAFARERHSIYLRRQAEQAWPWTVDPILQKYSFTNVFRELDKTTIWWRRVSDTMRDKPEVLLATVLFRWFNRITTGEAIFSQGNLPEGTARQYSTAWTKYRDTGDTDLLKRTIKLYCRGGPYVTGSYIILGQQGMPKLDGVLACLKEFYGGEWPFVGGTAAPWHQVAEFCLKNPGMVHLETIWKWLRQVPYLGDFMAYEIVTDLRWTDLLSSAPDIMTWANPGPGAARGLARIHGRDISGRKITRVPKRQLIDEMRELLALSRKPEYWPQQDEILIATQRYVVNERALQVPGAWPALEMRDIEHTLCEFDKYRRAQTGEGRPRGTYRHG